MGMVEASNPTQSMNFGPIFIAIAATTWTFDFVARSTVLAVMSPTMLVMFEHLIMTLIAVPVLIRSRHLFARFNRKEWAALIAIGAGASALATVALSTGYALGFFQYAPMVALSQQFQPVIAIGFAHLALKEKLPNYYYPLSIVAIIGVFLMYFPTVSGLSGDLLNDLGIQAALLGLIAAILWGAGTVLGKYLLVHSETEIDYLEMASFRFLIGLLTLVVFNSIVGFEITDQVNTTIGLNILFIALVPGLFALVLYYYGLKSTHASVATLFELAFPLSFFILIPILTDIMILPIQYAGAIILIAATTRLSIIYGRATSPDQFKDYEDDNLYPSS